MNSFIESLRKILDETWNGLIGKSAGMSRRSLAWGGLALAGIILLAVNLLSWALLRGWNADMTADRLYTISSGTKQILRNMDEPVSARLYFSRRLGEAAPSYARYFDRVRALLEQYRDISGGKLDLILLDPEPFSDAEDRAVAAGLRGIRLNADGELGYFGLSATNSTDNEERISLFAPDRESFLEYDVTKLVYALSNPKKRVVGLLTALPIDGGTLPANMAMCQQAQQTPPWLIMDQIREFFDVEKIEENVEEIPSGIDVLMVAQPLGLTPQAAYAIDQFALKGGKVLVFIDPMVESAQMTMMSKAGKGRAELAKVLEGWGVEFDATRSAADLPNARRVQFGGRDGRGMVSEFVAWLALDRKSMDQGDVLSNGIDMLYLASSGFFRKVDGATVDVAPIVKTSSDAMEIDTRKVGMGADPVSLLRDYKPGGNALSLAVRLSGEANSAFPKGRPFVEDNLEDGTPQGAPAGAEKPDAEKKAETEAAKKPATEAGAALAGHIASGRINVIAIADTDLLADRFWAEEREAMGQKAIMPISNNAAFVVGALENLAGSDALIALRGRGVHERPFTLVEEIRREAERKFREKEEGLTKKLQSVQAELAKLEATGQEGAAVVTDKERQAIDKFKSEMLETRRELRDVQLALRHDIDNLDAWLKFANIALVPILLGLGAIGWSVWQSRRQKSG